MIQIESMGLEELLDLVAGAERVEKAGLILWNLPDGGLVVMARGADEGVLLAEPDPC
jgi:hypothetical protein